MTNGASGPMGGERPTAGTREPDGADHPALRGLAVVWLRANCPCATCQDPGSGQRLVSITELPCDVTVTGVVASDAAVEVVFGPDGHRAVFGTGWLARYGDPAVEHRPEPPAQDGTGPPWQDDGRTEDAKHMWAAADLGGELPQGWWPRYLADPAHRRISLSAVLTHGLVVLHDVPCVPGAVLAVAKSLGYVRETNYGRLFEVRAEPTPANLAFTSLPIAPHTDNPYRDPVPSVQLLHCLHAADGGGESTFTDGFRAAALLRSQDPAAFACLTTTPVTFAYSDAATVLRATGPMIGLDPRGRIRQIRFNGRSLAPVRLPAARARSFYAAYRAFAERIADPEAAMTARLSPGDCVIVDNTRVLHGRTGFADGGSARTTGRRHLQGCYADLDGLESAVAVLARSEAGRAGS
ncbi:MAG: TauD/TfdA family dioxygenase [Streptosporangiaceae bacterium]